MAMRISLHDLRFFGGVQADSVGGRSLPPRSLYTLYNEMQDDYAKLSLFLCDAPRICPKMLENEKKFAFFEGKIYI